LCKLVVVRLALVEAGHWVLLMIEYAIPHV